MGPFPRPGQVGEEQTVGGVDTWAGREELGLCSPVLSGTPAPCGAGPFLMTLSCGFQVSFLQV
jgi:hypothetical protein